MDPFCQSEDPEPFATASEWYSSTISSKSSTGPANRLVRANHAHAARLRKIHDGNVRLRKRDFAINQSSWWTTGGKVMIPAGASATIFWTRSGRSIA